jgi:hypothetical protein
MARAIRAVAWTFAGLVSVGAGCSSSSPGSVTPCASAPTPPAQDDFCAATAGYYGRCGHCADCTELNLRNCDKKGSAISAAYRAAFIACKDDIPCTGLVGADPGGDPSFSPCVVDKMKGATPTAAQTQAKTAYCSACSATNAADCANFFAEDGPGYNVLLYGDALAAMAQASCMASCDKLKYAICVAFLACGPTGGDFCSDGGLCAPH